MFSLEKFIKWLKFSWQLNPRTLTRVKGQTLPSFYFYFFNNWFSHPILTQVKIDSLVFNQDIIHGDSLKGSDQHALAMSKGIYDTHPTLVKTRHKNKNITLTHLKIFNIKHY
jgi:hypothetical protein